MIATANKSGSWSLDNELFPFLFYNYFDSAKVRSLLQVLVTTFRPLSNRELYAVLSDPLQTLE